jgi:MoaA/NifB/PqqE/SkfB family radical SAM enzyme
MRLTGLHLLLTYRCDRACDHCFVWGSPDQTATMTYDTVRTALRQAKDLGTVEWIYFEGGEPFLYYPVLVRCVRKAERLGFRVGIVTNAYWATSAEDAVEWLWPLAGWVQDLSVSADGYHGTEGDRSVEWAQGAARELGIPTGEICIDEPDAHVPASVGTLPEGTSRVMYRGRAAVALAPGAPGRPWTEFDTCPHEELRSPDRVHLDPFGEIHVCQGISIGNVFRTPLERIVRAYDPDAHVVVGPLLRGGPAELVREHELPHRERVADACHLCYEARVALRPLRPDELGPDPMYGVPEAHATLPTSSNGPRS